MSLKESTKENRPKSLRPKRQKINYKEAELSFEKQKHNDSEEESKTYEKKIKCEVPNFDEVNKLTEYEKRRLQSIEENKKMMMQLGLLDTQRELKKNVTNIKPKIKLESRKKSSPKTPLVQKKSLRLQGKTPDGLLTTLTPTINDTPKIEDSGYKRRKVEELPMTDDEKGVDMLDKLRNRLNSSSATVMSSLDIEKLIDDTRQINLTACKPKVVHKRIQSICVHPIETKLVVIAGSTEGTLGLWDVDSVKIDYEPHVRAVNCVTVNFHDHNKILSTSHDGTLRQADIEKEVSQLIYQTNEDDRISHITWHCDRLLHNILVAHGNGNVGIIDDRLNPEKSLVKMFKCHERSVRTVQLHPVQPYYFLTSSGTGQAKIFDIRLSKDNVIGTLEHYNNKSGCGLTSAFYSPDGSKVLTTCNDDRVRVFDVSNQSKPVEAHKVIHNNHTGRWLSVFKAKWHPSSSDMFFIGSMQYPKRVQIYNGQAELMREIKHDDLTTICPVLDIHPTQPIVAGGDSVGRVYIFTTPSLIDKFSLLLD